MVTLLVTAGLLVGVLLSIYYELPSHLLQTEEYEEFQEWLLEKERINDHIVKVCEKYGETAREKINRHNLVKYVPI